MKAFVSKYENISPVSAVLSLNATIDQMRIAIAQAVVDSCDQSWGVIGKESVIMPAFVSGA